MMVDGSLEPAGLDKVCLPESGQPTRDAGNEELREELREEPLTSLRRLNFISGVWTRLRVRVRACV